MRRQVAAIPIVVMRGACGSRVALKPSAGNLLPVAPTGRDDRPSAEELLVRSPQSAPERSVELRKRSEERADDPFDLPPEDNSGEGDSPTR